MTALRLVYTEYENGQPPFAWMHGDTLAAEDHHKVHKMLGAFGSARGRTAQGGYGRAVRHQDALLLDTSVGVQHASGTRQGIVVALFDVGQPVDWAAKSAARIGGILIEVGVQVNQGQLRAALERGWADTAQRFPGRFVRAALAYLVRTARRAFSRHSRYRGRAVTEKISVGTGD